METETCEGEEGAGMKYGVSYYGGVGAPTSRYQSDQTYLRKLGFSLFRVWANWGWNTLSERVIKNDGTLDATNLNKLKAFIAYTKSWGGSVDVTIGCGGALSPNIGFASYNAHKAGVTNLVTALRGISGIYCIDVANEYPSNNLSSAQAAELLKLARAADGSRGGFTVSVDGPATSRVVPKYKEVISALGKNWQSYLGMYAPHFNPQDKNLAKNTEANVKALKSGMASYPLSIYVQEEGYWNHPYTTEQEYYDESRGCRVGGATAYTLHTLAGFDLRTKSFVQQLVPTEAKVLPFVPLK